MWLLLQTRNRISISPENWTLKGNGIPMMMISLMRTTPNDVGPGERVLGEPLSHGRDLANMSGHAIPAMLYSNQYAVLYDTEPTEIEVLD